MNKKICGWVKLDDPLYINYHNQEWGKAIHDDNKLFELFSLETQASGLSWLTILKRRENYRKAFENFDLNKVVLYNQDDINRIFINEMVIKSRPKIEAIVNNAKLFLKIKEEFGSIDNYFWSKVNYKTVINNVEDYKNGFTKSELSDQIAKDLKKRGFKFVGSISVYAFLQACGIINDHENSCSCKNNNIGENLICAE